MICHCPICKNEFYKSNSHYNRAIKLGLNLFCGRACAGISRRGIEKTIEQKKAEKAAYDKRYRKEYTEELKKEKHEYHKRTYDKEKAASIRKERMPKHIEYCRQPKYKEWKKKYDKKHRAKKQYGEFAEAALILFKIESEIERKSPELLAIKFQNGTLNKSQKRKRTWQTKHNQN